MSHRVVVGVALALLAGAGSVAAQGSGRAFVLDEQARSLTALALPDGRVEQTAALQGTPSILLRTADGRRLLVLDRGEGRDAGDQGYQARTRAALTILDGRTLAVRGRVELGWGLDPNVMLSAAGDRLSVVGRGYQGKSPADSLPREVVTVDLAAATVLSRIELPSRASAFLATPDGRTAVVLSAREELRRNQVVPAELRFLDLVAGAVAATVPLEGDPRGPVLAPDGEFLYLLDRGRPSDNPDKNVNGRLHVVSMVTRSVAGVTEVGSKPRGLVLDDSGRQLLLLSDSPPVKGPGNRTRPGELRVIRGATPGAPIAVGTSPERLELSGDGKALYVLGTNTVTRLTLPGLSPEPAAVFDRWGEELHVSADGRRAYVLNGEYFYTYDLATGKRVGDVRTGRMGKKMFLALETGLKTETSRLEAENEARRQGRSYYTYTEYTLREPRGTMILRPDGQEIYALNSQTSDVTVIDADAGTILEKVPAGGFAVHFMPAAAAAVIPSAGTVHVVDLATRTKRPDLVTDSPANFRRATLSPDATVLVVHGTGGVLIAQASAGKVAGTMKTFSRVADVVVDWGAAAR